MHAQQTIHFLTARIPLDIRSKDSSIHLSYVWLQVYEAQREDCRLFAGNWERIGRSRGYVPNIHAHHPCHQVHDICHSLLPSLRLILFAAPFIGDIHKRQRKVMLPAFGTSESRALIPVFESAVAKVNFIFIGIFTTRLMFTFTLPLL
jgi:hypothetical protein